MASSSATRPPARRISSAERDGNVRLLRSLCPPVEGPLRPPPAPKGAAPGQKGRLRALERRRALEQTYGRPLALEERCFQAALDAHRRQPHGALADLYEGAVYAAVRSFSAGGPLASPVPGLDPAREAFHNRCLMALFLHDPANAFFPVARQLYARVVEKEAGVHRRVVERVGKSEGPEFSQAYAADTGMILFHLHGPLAKLSNHHSLRALLDPGQEWGVEAEDHFPGVNDAILADLNKRLSQKVEKTVSRLYTCPRCKKKRCSWREVQMRSCDEPATIRCRCLECDHEFSAN